MRYYLRYINRLTLRNFNLDEDESRLSQGSLKFLQWNERTILSFYFNTSNDFKIKCSRSVSGTCIHLQIWQYLVIVPPELCRENPDTKIAAALHIELSHKPTRHKFCASDEVNLYPSKETPEQKITIDS